MKTTNTAKLEPDIAADVAREPSKRRRHPRFAVDVQASVSLASRQLSARTRDVSRAGLCLVSLEAIPRGSEIAIELVLTFGEDGMSEPLHVLGEVVWCTPLFGAFQIGVKFVKVDEEQSRYLNMFIGFLDGSLSHGDSSEDETGELGHAPGRAQDPDDPFAV
jgi:hypothetical protein